MTRWRTYAADAYVFPHLEGTPLLEVRAGGAILQVLERTGPYGSAPGRARVILNPTVRRLEPGGEAEPGLATAGIGALAACGPVLLREGNMVVVDAGVPLVVGVEEPLPDDLAIGDRVRFESRPPIHGFVVPSPRRGPAGQADDAV